MGSGGGRAVASDTTDPRFKSRHWQNFIYQFDNQNTEKTKIKKKRPGMAHLKKTVIILQQEPLMGQWNYYNHITETQCVFQDL